MLTTIESPILRDVLEYWLRICPAGGLPHRRCFNPADLPRRALPHITLFDILDSEPRYRVRLFGTYLVDAYGWDFTGRHLVESEIPGVGRSKTIQLLACVETGAPQYYKGPTDFRCQNDYLDHEQLMLPLRSNNKQVGFAIGVVDYKGFRRLLPAGRVAFGQRQPIWH